MRKAHTSKFNTVEVIDTVARLDAYDIRNKDVVSEVGCSKSHIYNIRQHPEYRKLYEIHRETYLQRKQEDAREVHHGN